MKEDRPSRFFRVVLVHWRFKSIDFFFFHKRITVLEGVLSTRNKYNQNNNGALIRPFKRDFTMPCLKHFIEILPRSAYTISQRFYNALLIPFYSDFTMLCLYQFTEISLCHAYPILQMFYNALPVPFYRDFIPINVQIYKDCSEFFGMSVKFWSLLTNSKGRIY